MNVTTRHTYPLRTPGMDAELQAYRGMRAVTLRHEYDRLAAVAVAERTPWQRIRVETLRLTLGIGSA